MILVFFAYPGFAARALLFRPFGAGVVMVGSVIAALEALRHPTALRLRPWFILYRLTRP